MSTEVTMEKIVALAKGRGFVYPGSEIYGGLANTWDYGPLGVEFKNNIKKAWWRKFVQESKYNVGLDAAILMNPRTWEASGHVGGFSDPLIDCKNCHSRFRADKLIEDFIAEKGLEPVVVDGWPNEKLEAYIADNGITCPDCGKKDFTDIRQFNLMFKTFQGVTEDTKSQIYLRPETAQGIFVNFKNVQRTSRKKIPFGIAQIGKSFRNEITPGNFTFRTREFEQMELEFFCKPGTDLEWFEYWKNYCHEFLPKTDEDMRQLSKTSGIPYEKIAAEAQELQEFNPMLGHRGCRLAVTYPEIAEMQTEAIITAALEVKNDLKIDIVPEIMIPLVGSKKELMDVKKTVIATAEKCMKEFGDTIEYMIGTMIEVPRAAVTADEIAEEAEFFSFGTNDLTQMTFGFSRDDTAGIIEEYIKKGILESDPFKSIDQTGVGKLMEQAVKLGKKTRPNIHLGICGEHGCRNGWTSGKANRS